MTEKEKTESPEKPAVAGEKPKAKREKRIILHRQKKPKPEPHKGPIPKGMYKESYTGQLKKKRMPKTIRERKVVKTFIETGDYEAAGRAGYNASTKASAITMAHQVLNKIDIGKVMDQHGLSDDYLVLALKEGLESANKIHGTNDDFIETPDYATRHKYLETAFKLRGYWGDRMKIAMEKDGEKVRILLDLPK